MHSIKSENSKIKLISSDNNIFMIPRKYIAYSNLLKVLFNEDDNDNEVKIQLTDKTLVKIIEFYKLLFENNNKIYNSIYKNIDSIDECFKKYIDINMNELHSLSNGANYLDSKDLLHLCVKKIASKLRGLSLMEIKENYNIENKFTDEEKVILNIK